MLKSFRHEPELDMSEITDKIRELENRVALYEAIFERLDVGIHVIDMDRQTVLYNEAMSRMEGEDPMGIIGRPFMASNSFFKNKDSTLLKVLKTGETVSNNTQTYCNSQGQNVVTVNKTQPLTLGGRMVGAMEIATDITYIQRLTEKIMDLHENSKRKRSGSKDANCPDVRYTFDSILGRSPNIRQVITHAKKIAQTSSNVLIFGETGTGKELFAQSIHAASDRRSKPFVDINCAALPSQLLEGILFGSVKGGFTDAQDRPGLFEQANGGTLLLDEVNSMHLPLQGKLLRALQEKRIRRLGATNSIDIDVRVISTTNKTPEEAIEQKELREDLYYRLSVANLNIPPLRHRQDDIPVYTMYFLEKYASKLGLRINSCSREVKDLFQKHPWPGNVRQLEHAIEGALNLVNANDEVLLREHLPMLFNPGEAEYGGPPEKMTDFQTEREKFLEDGLHHNEGPEQDERNTPADRGRDAWAPPGGLKLNNEKQEMEYRIISQSLADNDNNISRAARQIGITRQLLQYKIKKYGLTERVRNSQKE
ncbi:sigma-54-dependent Fis family transcriptional regulator [Deltaproteobacteria bacterium Smac51]|nr:sigma-54-dependent Fis family transcriptional regulator [Deltaproteobacteria bacterium Smac51]